MIEIRQLDSLDEQLIQHIAELKIQLSPTHKFKPVNYQRAIDAPQTTVFSAWDRVKLVGLTTMNAVCTLDRAICDIDDVVVDEAYRGQGISRQLLDATIDHARSQGLKVARLTSRANREAANSLYLAYGFKLVETNKYRYFIK